MTLGLRAADHGLLDLYRLYEASRWQVLTQIRLPAALPYLLSAMKISGGLALIGTVVAEFVAGSGASMGLAWRIMESGNRLNIATMFAALLLLSLLGILIFLGLSLLEHVLLRRWHESRVERNI
jgi:NitT/TauT family transport system permease protein